MTVSLGEERIVRLTHPKRTFTRDFLAETDTVFVMPHDTNRAWKHAVPRLARYRSRRISGPGSPRWFLVQSRLLLGEPVR